jgi:beta-N-acetylhexosaminidase
VLRITLLTLIALLAIFAATNSSVFDFGGDSSGTVKIEKAPKSHPARKAAPARKVKHEERITPRAALGQMIVARFDGRLPSPAFLARIEAGEIGGVILFKGNLGGGEVAIGNRIRLLQNAAKRGGAPPLLIMVDQEGGKVKRLKGPPQSSAAKIDNADDAYEQGEATGYLLRRLGINLDLAPVADVHHHGSFLDSRTFSSSPAEVATLACEFAAGLREQGVAATLKHFPGLGLASTNTDEAAVTIDSPARQVQADYAPYQACAAAPLTLVMVNSAIYPALTGPLPAVLSPRTYDRELPRAGVTGPTISDDLETPAIRAQTTPARRAINAGLDLLLYAAKESASAEAYDRLSKDIRNGAIPVGRVTQAAAKILGLKKELAE